MQHVCICSSNVSLQSKAAFVQDSPYYASDEWQTFAHRNLRQVAAWLSSSFNTGTNSRWRRNREFQWRCLVPNGANLQINEFLTKQCYPNVSFFSERRCAMCFFRAQMLLMLQVSLASFVSSSGLEYLRSGQVAAQLALYLEGRGGSMQACNFHQYYAVLPAHKQIINKVPTFCASHKGLIAYTPDGTGGSCLYPNTAATFCESAATRSLTTKDFCTVEFPMVQFVASMANSANLVIGQGLKPKRKQLQKRKPKQKLRLQRLSFPRLQTLPTLSLQAWHCTYTRWVVLWEEVNLVTTTSLFHTTRI